MSFWHPEVTSLSARFLNLNKNLAKPKVENLTKQLFHLHLLDMRLANSYPTHAHGIIVKYFSEN